MLRPAPLSALLCASLATACDREPLDPTQTPISFRAATTAPKVFDGNGHRNVGALLADFTGDGTIQGFEAFCSGSLIAGTVFLTAAHCLQFLPSFGISQIWVSFDPELLDANGPSPLIPAVSFTWDPEFGHDEGDLHDLGVVILPAGAAAGITPVQLPTAGLLDAMAARGGLVGQLFVNVGYGVTPAWKGAPPRFSFDGRRNRSGALFMALTRAWLHLNQNPDATGEGGNCFGDSGSPHFLGESNLAVATTTSGDPICRAFGRHYRLDTPVARSFLGQFVTLP